MLKKLTDCQHYQFSDGRVVYVMHYNTIGKDSWAWRELIYEELDGKLYPVYTRTKRSNNERLLRFLNNEGAKPINDNTATSTAERYWHDKLLAPETSTV